MRAAEVDDAGRARAETILQAVGTTVWIEDEAQMDAVTAVSGSGPAYVFLFIEALQQAGGVARVYPEQARQLAIDTALGAGQSWRRSRRNRRACCVNASPQGAAPPRQR